jgi:hypothetical protein
MPRKGRHRVGRKRLPGQSVQRQGRREPTPKPKPVPPRVLTWTGPSDDQDGAK